MVGGGIGFLTPPIASSGSTGSIASGGKNTRPGWGPTPRGSVATDFGPPSTSSMLGSGPLRSATGSGRGSTGSGRPESGRDAGKSTANGSGGFRHASPIPTHGPT